MKFPAILRLTFALMLMPMLAMAQDTAEADNEAAIKKLSDNACECAREISTFQVKDSIISQINSCISAEIMKDQMTKLLGNLQKAEEDSAETKSDTVKERTIKIYAKQNFEEIQAYMLKNCPSVKTLMSAYDVKGKKSMSTNKKALEYYQEGQDYSAREQYDLAIVSYNKAVKKDPEFAFAWDNLGISYRKRGNFKEAIKCYEKSLEIDPNGAVPLQSMAVAYGLMNDFKKSAEVYDRFIKLHPEDPEGYFGSGRASYLAGDYSKGVDNMFKAYKIYLETESPYVNDAQQVLASFYTDLKEKGKFEIFEEAAKNNGINIQ